MSKNPAQKSMESIKDVETHLNLVQPRAAPAEKERIKEKIKVRAAKRKEMAIQQTKKGGAKRESRLIPAEGGGMGMGMEVE